MRVSDGKYSNASVLQNLTIQECTSQYNRPFVQRRGHLMAITSISTNIDNVTIPHGKTLIPHEGSTNRSMYYPGDGSSKGNQAYFGRVFICSRFEFEFRNECEVASLAVGKTEWKIGGFPIAYCLGQVVQEHCRLQLSVGILVVILCCNFITLACLLASIWVLAEKPLLTLGDAVDSFVTELDASTAGCGILSASDACKDPPRGRALWLGEQPRWGRGAGWQGWVSCGMRRV